MIRTASVAAAVILMSSVPASASARDSLIDAAFFARDRVAALAYISTAQRTAEAVLTRDPADWEAQITRAMATGYRAKLAGSRSAAIDARGQFEALVGRNPRDAEAQAALGGWHIGAVSTLGSLFARGALGARKATGLAAMDRAVALGGNRAMFLGLAALFRLELDPRDTQARQLAEAAIRAPAPTPIDRIVQRRATLILGVLRAGNAKATQATAKRLLPMGQFDR